jgi:hypothetical protein
VLGFQEKYRSLSEDRCRFGWAAPRLTLRFQTTDPVDSRSFVSGKSCFLVLVIALPGSRRVLLERPRQPRRIQVWEMPSWLPAHPLQRQLLATTSDTWHGSIMVLRTSIKTDRIRLRLSSRLHRSELAELESSDAKYQLFQAPRDSGRETFAQQFTLNAHRLISLY